MVVNNRGLKIIKEFEGLRTKSYLCPANKLTIGFGHTGPDVHIGQVINEREAEQLLQGDLIYFEHGVSELIGSATENEFSAMVCLAYNIGLGLPTKKNPKGGGFYASSVRRFHNQGNKGLAANSFMLWIKGGGKTLPGLIRRRSAERALYLSD